jgi:hypothetical protein
MEEFVCSHSDLRGEKTQGMRCCSRMRLRRWFGCTVLLNSSIAARCAVASLRKSDTQSVSF